MDLTLKFESEFDKNDFSSWLQNVGFSLYLEDSATSVNNLEQTNEGTLFVTTQPEPEVTELLVVEEVSDTWTEVLEEVSEVIGGGNVNLKENETLGSITSMFPEKEKETDTDKQEVDN